MFQPRTYFEEEAATYDSLFDIPVSSLYYNNVKPRDPTRRHPSGFVPHLHRLHPGSPPCAPRPPPLRRLPLHSVPQAAPQSPWLVMRRGSGQTGVAALADARAAALVAQPYAKRSHSRPAVGDTCGSW
jgi:hypothetical protein